MVISLQRVNWFLVTVPADIKCGVEANGNWNVFRLLIFEHHIDFNDIITRKERKASALEHIICNREGWGLIKRGRHRTIAVDHIQFRNPEVLRWGHRYLIINNNLCNCE